MKRLLDNPDIRYLLRQKSHTLTLHGESAVLFREKIVRCLDGRQCNYDDLIGTLESYRNASLVVLDLIGDLISMLQVLKAASADREEEPEGPEE